LRGDNGIDIEGYTWFGNNRKLISRKAVRGSGGVGILVRDSVLKYFTVTVVEKGHDGILWIQLINKRNKETLGVCVCYLPPSNSSREDRSQDFFDTLKALVIQNGLQGKFLICGDFNARCGYLQDCVMEECSVGGNRDVIDSTVNSAGRSFIEFLQTMELCMLNGRFGQANYTSVSSKGMAVVDYAIVPCQYFSHCSNFDINDVMECAQKYAIAVDSSVPDHSILTWEVAMPNDNKRNHSDVRETRILRTIPEEYFKSEEILRELHTLEEKMAARNVSENEINGIYDDFCEVIKKQLLCKRVKKRIGGTRHARSQPWWSSRLAELRDEVAQALQEWKNDKRTVEKRLGYIGRQKDFDKEVKHAKRRYLREQQQKLLEDQRYRPQSFWKKLNLGRSKKQAAIPETVLDDHGNEIIHKTGVLDCWRAYFEQLYNVNVEGDSGHVHAYPPVGQRLETDELNIEITVEEVEQAIKANEDKKAPGFDEIRANFIKNKQCITFLHKFFNCCLIEGVIPLQWQKGIIIPVSKKAKPTKCPNDYRGISLQSMILKTFCRILQSRLVNFLEQNEMLSDEQNGYRKGRSCQDHIFVLTSIIENRMCLKQDTYGCFIDFKKAFDSVNRDILWKKLEGRYGLHGKFLEILKSMYARTESCVRIGGSLTDWFDVRNGVKQGCILSPILFSLFLEDLVQEIKDLGKGVVCERAIVSLLLFADDMVLIAPNPQSLHLMLATVSDWCQRMGIKMNLEKTKIMHFRKKHRNRPRCSYTFTTREGIIEYVHEYKYLGVHINEHLNWEESLSRITVKARRALAGVNCKTRNHGGFHLKTYSKLFVALVESVILYSAMVWGNKWSKQFCSIQTQAMRFFLGVGKTCPNAALYGELGWRPIHRSIEVTVLKYWYRLCNLDGNRLTGMVFRWGSRLAEEGHNNWARRTQSLLRTVSNELGCPLPGSMKDFVKAAWSTLMGIEFNLWKEELNRIPKGSESGGRLALYRMFKDEPCPEDYITKIIPRDRRRTLVMLRSGCLGLTLETGRYRSPKVPVRERKCQLCKTNCVEDEIHFISVCPAYNAERAHLFRVASDCVTDFYTRTVMEKTTVILGLCGYNLEIGKAIHRMYKSRCSLTCIEPK
jgi:hypothetical protein